MPMIQRFETAFPAPGQRARFKDNLARLAPALARLRAAHDDGSLPLLRLPGDTADLESARPFAEMLARNTTDLCLLGTGGSALGARALMELQGYGLPGAPPPDGRPRIHVFDNLDPWTFGAALSRLDLRTTRFLAISKSGTTAETMMQALCALEAIRAAGGANYLAQHLAVITEPGPRPLRALAQAHGLPIIDHPPGVGGRYAVLSVVGLVPALCAGLDPVRVRTGAARALAPVLSGAAPGDVPAAAGAAWSLAVSGPAAPMLTLLSYADRLHSFGLWWRQLWAESVGKDGLGTTPVPALGPVDQHSQLQLYLAGPADKAFTLIGPDHAGAGPVVPGDDAAAAGMAYLGGRAIGDLVGAQVRATAATLAAAGRPLRRIEVGALDEDVMGELFMHFMLETILAAGLMGVDPFDQPAVEEGKRLARADLEAMAKG